MKKRTISEAQRISFYKFEPDTNLKECEKLSGTQFDVFETEIKSQSNVKRLGAYQGKWRQIEQLKDKMLLARGVDADLLDYDLTK